MNVDIAVVKDANKLIRKQMKAINAVMELHKPMWNGEYCGECHPDHNGSYPCPTIQALRKELGE